MPDYLRKVASAQTLARTAGVVVLGAHLVVRKTLVDPANFLPSINPRLSHTLRQLVAGSGAWWHQMFAGRPVKRKNPKLARKMTKTKKQSIQIMKLPATFGAFLKILTL